MSENSYTMRRALGMLRAQLVKDIYEMQERIILVERFGEQDVILHPTIQTKPGATYPLSEMKQRHAEALATLRRLADAIDAASAEAFSYEISEYLRSRR